MEQATAARLLKLAKLRAKEAVCRTRRQRKLVRRLDAMFGRRLGIAHELLDQLEVFERLLLQECDRLRTIRKGAG